MRLMQPVHLEDCNCTHAAKAMLRFRSNKLLNESRRATAAGAASRSRARDSVNQSDSRPESAPLAQASTAGSPTTSVATRTTTTASRHTEDRRRARTVPCAAASRLDRARIEIAADIDRREQLTQRNILTLRHLGDLHRVREWGAVRAIENITRLRRRDARRFREMCCSIFVSKAALD